MLVKVQVIQNKSADGCFIQNQSHVFNTSIWNIHLDWSRGCMPMCFRVGEGYSEEFEVKVDVHQGSVLSLLLFITVLEASSHKLWGPLGGPLCP